MSRIRRCRTDENPASSKIKFDSRQHFILHKNLTTTAVAKISDFCQNLSPGLVVSGCHWCQAG